MVRTDSKHILKISHRVSKAPAETVITVKPPFSGGVTINPLIKAHKRKSVASFQALSASRES